MKGKRVQEIEE
jgi:hypothetical protein